jgi:hypothetical protein
VIDLLRQYTAGFLDRHGNQAPPQVQNTLAKLAMCRTLALGEHVYECPQCQYRSHVYNSCLDRHCPLCSGGRRADWLDKTARLLLPKVDYFQIVFTVPEALWGLMLGNRRATYRLLFQAAWGALGEVLREALGCVPAALMVLHTWNQRLEHYPHLHALVPGGGPSFDGQRWIQSQHPYHHGRHKPYLADNTVLSDRFRAKFLAGLARLHDRSELKLQDSWSDLQDPAAFVAWLNTLDACDWVVYIQPPETEDAQPEHVLKYLARYLTGGPISDRRLIAHQDGKVTFWARSRDKGGGNPSEAYTLTGVEFTRRWALHILPKGFVKSRCFGGFSCRQRKAYLTRCRTLVGSPPAPSQSPEASADEPAEAEPSTPLCPRCQTPLQCVFRDERVSWRSVVNGPHGPAWYGPLRHALTWGCLDGDREPPDG